MERCLMDDLTYTLHQLCLRNRDGSFTTQSIGSAR
jgi:hypothetical protein